VASGDFVDILLGYDQVFRIDRDRVTDFGDGVFDDSRSHMRWFDFLPHLLDAALGNNGLRQINFSLDR
jgi:hypothetical protein